MQRSNILLTLMGIVLAGCSQSGGGAVTELQARCPKGAVFCLTTCNLGCAAGGCSVSEIAQNQPVILEFSKNVDPASVNAATLSIRTASGEAPNGQITVDRNKVTFTPSILLSAGGATLFGFQAGREYRVALPGPGTGASIRSVSGESLSAAVNCTVRVSQGIVDLDQTPPHATLMAPTAKEGVPRQVTIVVEFGELIDTSAYQGSSTEFSPIKYELRKPLRDQNGALIRDPNTGLAIPDPAFVPVRIEGVPRAEVTPGTQKTRVSLTPVIPLPPESWVELTVTDQVKDLAGTPAITQRFSFFTENVPLPPENVVEDFSRASNFDGVTSSGTWGGNQAIGGAIGGDGLHGSFDVRVGAQQGGPDRYRWNTDNTVIPGRLTLSGKDETVTDGRFYFTDFTLARGLTLEFVGSKPAQIFVRGRVNIEGTITANAPRVDQDELYRPDNPRFRARPNTAVGPIAGQPTKIGIVGGGNGGRGADSGDGVSHQTRFDGADGEDVQLQAGHAYMSRAVGTGGKGSPQFPATGLSADVTFGFLEFKSSMVGAGGGGGGFFIAGAPGVATLTSSVPSDLGPSRAGGRAINLFADAQGSLPPGTFSLDHFTIGGSGGGGGGSHPFLGPKQFSNPGQIWVAGAAGGPGGGAIAIRAGGRIVIQPTGTIQARGGDGITYNIPADNFPMPGGAGSGGSILLQSDIPGGIESEGLLDTGGGLGSSLAASFPNASSHGGNGAPGFIRLETPGGNIVPGSTVPALGVRNVGTLTDTDQKVGAQSRWYSTRQSFPPEFLYYVVEAEIDGLPVTFSDDPTQGQRADLPNGPVYILFQAAEVNYTTREPTTETIGPWRKYVGTSSGEAETLNLDEGTGFRFNLIFNRNVTPDIVVKSVTVWFRG